MSREIFLRSISGAKDKHATLCIANKCLAAFHCIAREIIMHQISCGLSCHRGTSETHRRCLRLLRLRDTHTYGHTQTVSNTDMNISTWKTRRCCVRTSDLLIDHGFDLARSYRFRVVASWRVILSIVHKEFVALMYRDLTENVESFNSTETLLIEIENWLFLYLFIMYN